MRPWRYTEYFDEEGVLVGHDPGWLEEPARRLAGRLAAVWRWARWVALHGNPVGRWLVDQRHLMACRAALPHGMVAYWNAIHQEGRPEGGTFYVRVVRHDIWTGSTLVALTCRRDGPSAWWPTHVLVPRQPLYCVWQQHPDTRW